MSAIKRVALYVSFLFASASFIPAPSTAQSVEETVEFINEKFSCISTELVGDDLHIKVDPMSDGRITLETAYTFGNSDYFDSTDTTVRSLITIFETYTFRPEYTTVGTFKRVDGFGLAFSCNVPDDPDCVLGTVHRIYEFRSDRDRDLVLSEGFLSGLDCRIEGREVICGRPSRGYLPGVHVLNICSHDVVQRLARAFEHLKVMLPTADDQLF